MKKYIFVILSNDWLQPCVLMVNSRCLLYTYHITYHVITIHVCGVVLLSQLQLRNTIRNHMSCGWHLVFSSSTSNWVRWSDRSRRISWAIPMALRFDTQLRRRLPIFAWYMLSIMIDSNPSMLPRNSSLIITRSIARFANRSIVSLGVSERLFIPSWRSGCRCCKTVASWSIYLAIITGCEFALGMFNRASLVFSDVLERVSYGIVKISWARIKGSPPAWHILSVSFCEGSDSSKSRESLSCLLCETGTSISGFPRLL